MMQKISIDSVIFCENSKYTFGLCNLYTFKRVLASSNVCPFLSAKFLQLQDVFPKKKWRTVLCRWFMWGWGSLSPICDCATIVDFRSQSGENGSPSSASLSPWKHKSFLSQNPSVFDIFGQIRRTLQTCTHTSLPTHLPLHTICSHFYQQTLDSSEPLPECVWAANVFHFLLCFVTNRWDVESGGNVLWRGYLSAIRIPRDKRLVKATTITIALIMGTMWINNGRDLSSVAPFKRLSFFMRFTITPFIIYSINSLSRCTF